MGPGSRQSSMFPLSRGMCGKAVQTALYGLRSDYYQTSIMLDDNVQMAGESRRLHEFFE